MIVLDIAITGINGGKLFGASDTIDNGFNVQDPLTLPRGV
jgi:hypothetical protein